MTFLIMQLPHQKKVMQNTAQMISIVGLCHCPDEPDTVTVESPETLRPCRPPFPALGKHTKPVFLCKFYRRGLPQHSIAAMTRCFNTSSSFSIRTTLQRRTYRLFPYLTDRNEADDHLTPDALGFVFQTVQPLILSLVRACLLTAISVKGR